MMALPFILLGLMTGVIFASQGAINGRLAASVGGPLTAAFISFSVGWLALGAMMLLTRPQAPMVAATATAPWWAYLGGFIGAVGVTSAALSVPKIGVATWVGAVIAGQLVSSLLLDHYGAFGQAVREVTPGRLLGVLFLAVGVILIRRF